MRRPIGNSKASSPLKSLPFVACGGPALLSGRDGDYVLYVRKGKQFRRRYVLPKDPRTPKQLRCRAALGGASKHWSHSPELTEAQREACRTVAAGVQSRPRLGQSGPLTGQQYYVGKACAKVHPAPERVPAQPQRAATRRMFGKCGRNQSVPALQPAPRQRLTPSTWEKHRVHTVEAPLAHGAPGQVRTPGLRLCKRKGPRKAPAIADLPARGSPVGQSEDHIRDEAAEGFVLDKLLVNLGVVLQ